MVKKQSLSDLLQEEAQKFTPPEGESAIEVTAEKIVEEQASSDEESSAQPLEPTSTKRTSSTKADLETTVKELTSNLETSHKKEASLGQEIADLQSKLSKQKTFASEQKSLLEQLTKELEETKKTALQLAEANSKLIEEINALKQTAEDNSKLAVAVKETSAIKPVKEQYNPYNYKKSHLSSERLAQNQPDEYAGSVAKETSAIKPVKDHYNPLNYKKSHRSSQPLAQNQPQNQPNEYPESSNEMWLLD
ncbi:hypothetical protein [Nostoc sp. 'Lobaria pulmonaria (5183) cyanobiont']|uniref:hypothetical protein n=1 Tax=Nostoc sp. 'Lobaria pulmonaria (5183) cyanobiont' TaxID=1618022 RepID=UPI000CF3027A|nr:hypothetical protein [Nostoc sp. 'Lobaria pulmonaria (5183) cyanobiont']AVH73474.1 hypothetical protein NLP_5131 [Nostoc sp. 'Lobaria pulmonaria (5183) cyanobiont']